jgi:hypothetical protein
MAGIGRGQKDNGSDVEEDLPYIKQSRGAPLSWKVTLSAWTRPQVALASHSVNT